MSYSGICFCHVTTIAEKPSTVCIRKKRQSEIFNEEKMNCDESQKDDDSTDSNLPTTLETLGNHLHAQISSYFPHLYKETVSKVTGVLLECGQQDVLAMLQDFQLLQKRVARVLPLIIPQSSANTTEQAKNQNIPASSWVFFNNLFYRYKNVFLIKSQTKVKKNKVNSCFFYALFVLSKIYVNIYFIYFLLKNS